MIEENHKITTDQSCGISIVIYVCKTYDKLLCHMNLHVGAVMA